MKNAILVLYVSFACAALTGCASFGKMWKGLISQSPPPEEANAAPKVNGPRYSEQQQLLPTTDRRYRRMTRKTMENDARLDARAGSLWVMEGQGAYLFSENTVRMIGDPIAVRIEGEPKEQLMTKADVIADLLKQLEERRKRALKRVPDKNTNEEENKEESTESPQQNVANVSTPAATRAPAGESKNFNVKIVPTRVVERMVDGNYRVRGSQSFMIGSREYKVLVSGIVRAEDFNEQGVSATQLLDPSFDIVSARGAELRQ